MYPASQNYAGSYATAQKEGMSPIEIECRAFICAASALNKVKENWETEKNNLPEALEKNKMLWSIIASAMQEEDCPQPQNIRKNILQLSVFVFKRTLELLGNPNPEGIDVLVNINMNIARGLNGNSGE